MDPSHRGDPAPQNRCDLCGLSCWRSCVPAEAAGGTLVPAGSAGEAQASHVVVQHREQPICGMLGGRVAVSFVWVYACVRAGRLLDVAEDKARPPLSWASDEERNNDANGLSLQEVYFIVTLLINFHLNLNDGLYQIM